MPPAAAARDVAPAVEPQPPPGTPPARRASEPAPPSTLAADGVEVPQSEAAVVSDAGNTAQDERCAVAVDTNVRAESPLLPAPTRDWAASESEGEAEAAAAAESEAEAEAEAAAEAEAEAEDVVSTGSESDDEWEAPSESSVPPRMQPRLGSLSSGMFAPSPMSSRRGSVAPPGSFSPRVERSPLKRHSSVGAPREMTHKELADRLAAGMAQYTLAAGATRSRRPRRPSLLLEELAAASPTLASVIEAVNAASMGVTVNPLPEDEMLAKSAKLITTLESANAPNSYVTSRGTSEATKLGDDITAPHAPAPATPEEDRVIGAIVTLCREAHRAAQEDFEVEGVKTYQPLWTVPASLPHPTAAPERISPDVLAAHAAGARNADAAAAALDALVCEIDGDRIAARHGVAAADSVAIVEGAELIAATVRAAARSQEPIAADRIVKRLGTVLRAGSAEDLANEAVNERKLKDGVAADAALQARIVELRDAIVASSSSYENVGQLASMEAELDALMVRRFDTFDEKRRALLEVHFPPSSPFIALDGGRAPLVAELESDAREAEGVIADAKHDVATLLEQLAVARQSEAAYQESLAAELAEKKLARDECSAIADDHRQVAITALRAMVAAEKASKRIDFEIAAEEEGAKVDQQLAELSAELGLDFGDVPLARGARSTHCASALRKYTEANLQCRLRLSQVVKVREIDAKLSAATMRVVTPIANAVRTKHAKRAGSARAHAEAFDDDVVALHSTLWSAYERARIQLVHDAKEDAHDAAELEGKERAFVAQKNFRRAQRVEAQRESLAEEIRASGARASELSRKARVLDERAAPSYFALRARGVDVLHPYFRTQGEVIETFGAMSMRDIKAALMKRKEELLTPRDAKVLASITPKGVGGFVAIAESLVDGAATATSAQLPACDVLALAGVHACAVVPKELRITAPVTLDEITTRKARVIAGAVDVSAVSASAAADATAGLAELVVRAALDLANSHAHAAAVANVAANLSASVVGAAADAVGKLTQETDESSPHKVGVLRAQVREALERRRSPAKGSPAPAKGARAAEAEAEEKRRASPALRAPAVGNAIPCVIRSPVFSL